MFSSSRINATIHFLTGSVLYRIYTLDSVDHLGRVPLRWFGATSSTAPLGSYSSQGHLLYTQPRSDANRFVSSSGGHNFKNADQDVDHISSSHIDTTFKTTEIV